MDVEKFLKENDVTAKELLNGVYEVSKPIMSIIKYYEDKIKILELEKAELYAYVEALESECENYDVDISHLVNE